MFDSMFGSTPFSGVVSQADFPTNGATGLLLLAATLTPTEWTPVAKAISGGGKDYASSTLTSSFKGLVHWWWLGAAGGDMAWRILMRLSAIHLDWQVRSNLGDEMGLLPANQAGFALKIRVAASVEEASNKWMVAVCYFFLYKLSRETKFAE